MPDSGFGPPVFGEALGGQASRVTEDGIALLHKDNVVLTAQGGKAAAELAVGDSAMVVNYYFPVEIEIRGGGEEKDPKEAVLAALAAFASGLENLA